MATFESPRAELANVPRGVQAQVAEAVASAVEAAGRNLRSVFFRAVNATVGLLNAAGLEGASRSLATALVRFERNAQRAAVALQAEHEAGGPAAAIPVDPKLGPGEVRLNVRTEVELPRDQFSGPVYFSIRSQGIPTREQVEAALLEMLESFGEEYEVARIERYVVGPFEYLRVEGGG